MATVGTLKLDLIIDGKKAEVTIENVEDDFNKLGKSGDEAGNRISNGFSKAKIGILAAAGAIALLAKGLNSVVNKSSEYNDVNSKMLTIFRDMPKEARTARDELVNMYGQSYTGATKLLAATGDLLTGLGMQQKASLDLSLATQKLAIDLRSMSPEVGTAEQASRALTSAMLGEREALKTWGIVISEEMVKQELFAKGKQNLTGLALQQAKAEATLTLAYKQSTNAVGDYKRTYDSYENTIDRISNSTENISMMLGSVFLPIWSKAAMAIDDLFKRLDPNAISGTLHATWAAFKDFGTRIYDLFSNFGGLIKAIFTGDIGAIPDKIRGMWNAITADWDKTVYKIAEGYKRGVDASNAFMEGSVSNFKKVEEQAVYTATLIANQMQNMFTKTEQILADSMQNQLAAIGNRYAIEQQQMITTANLRQDTIRAMEQSSTLYQANQAKSYTQQMAFMLGTASQSSKGMFSLWKGAAYAAAVANTFQAATKTWAQWGFPWGIPAVAAVLAAGSAQVMNIKNTKFTPMAVGGEVTEPTLTLLGEAGQPEIVAPKDDFIRVVNNLVRGGELGMNNYSQQDVQAAVTQGVQNALTGNVFKLDFDSESLAIAVERGNDLLIRAEI